MRLLKSILLVLIPAWLCCGLARAQVAGLGTLSVLDMTTSARSAGLGMDYITLYDSDINIVLDNPSLIDSRFDKVFSLNYVGMFQGTNFGSLAYGFNTKKVGTFLVGMRFLNYGSFEGYDEYENPTGRFSAGDYALTVGWGMAVNPNFSIGANFKPVLSQYYIYTGVALALDVSASYVNDSRRFSATAMARNIGAQILTFDGSVESIPFELSAAMSYKLENAPFRVFVAATELQRWNLMYDDPLRPTETTDMFGEVHRMSKAALIADNLFRHIQLGLEMNLGSAFYARVGYNHRQAREIKSLTYEAFNTSGFSFGIGFRVKGLDFAYARNNYHLGQAPNFISVTKHF